MSEKANKLVIVESPAKARTISKFLGSDYTIKASMGHIRDLPKKKLGFDPEQNFQPEYEVTPDKKKVITELKRLIDKKTEIYLASDEDREGEAISWHLIPALKIEKNPIKRIVFHEITKPAILHAIENPREINQSLVDAQQARRVLDRAVGYELSPLLWKKVKYGLSAGRVQSVAVRIIVDREREIRAFKPEEFWKIKADHQSPAFQSYLEKIDGKKQKIPDKKSAQAIETSVKGGVFQVKDLTEKDGQRQPAPPFTTSTLQQEAARKLGFSVRQTMAVAQQLYEGNVGDIPGHSGGLITYMRTDSTNLSQLALSQAKEVVGKEFGSEYALSKPRVYATKSKGAQEAHEAIRPVDLSLKPSQIKNHLESQQFKLYDLIWKRTLATQMAPAKVKNSTVKIEAGAKKELEFQAKGLQIVFPGFMAAYTEGSDEPGDDLKNKETFLPKLEVGQILDLEKLHLEQHFTKPPPRYSEAALVKKMEAEGIGRPSTYAPTISTIQAREYVEKQEDKKLKPTAVGEVVNDFLVKHFPDIVDLHFTANMEEEMDKIAAGEVPWQNMLQGFYAPFHQQVGEKEETVSRDEVAQARYLGDDPKTGKPISVRLARYGPVAQLGNKDNEEEKLIFASLPSGMTLEEATLEDVLPLFKLPRVVGTTEDGEEIKANRGRFGPYLQVGKTYFSLKDDDPGSIDEARARVVIAEERERKAKNTIKVFEKEEIQVLNGRWGPYIKRGKDNFKIPRPKEVEIDDFVEQLRETITLEECLKIIEEAPAKKKFVRRKKKSS